MAKTHKIKTPKVLCLISGGYDSPVAAYLVKSRFEPIAIHFSIEPFTDNKPELKTRKLCKILGIKKLFVIKAGSSFAELVKKCNHRYYYVLSKRLMYRIAEIIAKKENCLYLVTGESLGQVSSQTLDNLTTIDKSVKITVLRPLLAYNKVEIINLAKKLKTYETSTGPEVCDRLGPKNPATRCDEKTILNEEKKLNIKKLASQAAKNAKSYSIH